MPRVSVFYGIAITMHWVEHGPPHFHARYGGAEATIDIREGAVFEGTLPPRVLRMTLEWATLHKDELLDNWELCASHRKPKPIPPLD